MRKGFTLIEVLAVIIVLGILALIATPIVLNSIEDSREKTAQSSVSNYAAAVEQAKYVYMQNNHGNLPINVNQLDIETNNDKVNCEVCFSNNHGVVLANCTVEGRDKKYYYVNNNVYNEMPSEIAILNECIFTTGDNNIVNPTPIGTVATTILDNGTTADYYDGKILTGTQTGNYVWYSGFLWRVMGKDVDGNVKLISEENITTASGGTNGFNWVNNYFYTKLRNNEYIVFTDWCDQEINHADDLATTTCSSKNTLGNAGMITAMEYKISGEGSSYLNNGQSFWTMTGNGSEQGYWNTDSEYNSNLISYMKSASYGIRPVIKMYANTEVTTGNGTVSNPYIVGDASDKTGSISSVVTAGDYINLNNKIYRVVNKDTSGVKVVYNGYYTDTLAFGTSTTFNNSDLYRTLNEQVIDWLEINDDNRVVNSTEGWEQGFEVSASFNVITYLNSKVTSVDYGKVGTLRFGEIFAVNLPGNYDRINTITLTRYNALNLIWSINSRGYAETTNVSEQIYRVRPAIRINNSTNITSGNGTVSSPYVLGS